MKQNFSLLRDLVLILPVLPKKRESGLFVIDNDPNSPKEGIVVAVGPGGHDKKGNHIEMPVKVGDRIIYMRTTKREIKFQGDSLPVIQSSDIICKIVK